MSLDSNNFFLISKCPSHRHGQPTAAALAGGCMGNSPRFTLWGSKESLAPHRQFKMASLYFYIWLCFSFLLCSTDLVMLMPKSHYFHH